MKCGAKKRLFRSLPDGALLDAHLSMDENVEENLVTRAHLMRDNQAQRTILAHSFVVPVSKPTPIVRQIAKRAGVVIDFGTAS